MMSRIVPANPRRHLSAATRLEAATANAIFDVAYHFDAAGKPERALPYALRAAAPGNNGVDADFLVQEVVGHCGAQREQAQNRKAD